ncbi:MAG: ASCH domain-containing protein [Planctomycetota bacterium]|jgi:hypothetical protein
MLFKKKFLAGLRDGSIDLTFRRWSRPQVKVGGRYRFDARSLVVVDAVDTVPLGQVKAAEARRAGFDGVDSLRDELRRGNASPLTSRTRVYRVAFHHEAEAKTGPQTSGSASDADVIVERLKRMDRLSKHGTWTRETLALVKAHPRQAASTLAPRLKRELRSFKADVRKLKGLGLTRSFEVGYEITPLGRRVLERL